MRFVAIADLHAHDWQDCSELLSTGRNSRLNDLLDSLNYVKEYCRRKKIKNVFVLGDVFHARGVIKVNVFSEVYAFFSQWSREADLSFLVGNHDWNFDLKSHSLEAFARFGKVVARPQAMVWENIYGSSYCNDQAVLKDLIKKVRKDKYDVVLMHQGIGGVPAGNGYYIGELISKTELPKDKIVLSGHYHEHRRIQKNAWYVGSLLQLNWGDVGVKKYFLDVDTIRGTVTPVLSKGPSFVELEVAKSFVSDSVGPLVRGNFVRVKLASDKSSHAESIRDQLVRLKARFVTVATESSEDSSYVPLKTNEMDKLVAGYVRRSETKLNKKSLVRIGKEVVAAASEERKL